MWVGNSGGERGALRSKRVDLKDMVVVVVGGWIENMFFGLLILMREATRRLKECGDVFVFELDRVVW